MRMYIIINDGTYTIRKDGGVLKLLGVLLVIGICRHTEDELQKVVNDEAIDREKECIADGVDHKLICVGYQSFHRNTSLVIEADGR